MCQVKDAPIQDWVKLGVRRARLTNTPGSVLARQEPRPRRAVDRQGGKVPEGPGHLRPRHPHHGAGRGDQVWLERIRKGQDTISVTGNVLRDYLTDLFPIMEPGTLGQDAVDRSAAGSVAACSRPGPAARRRSMSSGSGEEGYLRWDSLGEFLALGASFEHLAQTTGNEEDVKVLAETLDAANGRILEFNRIARAQGRRDRQSRQPFLSGALLGPGSGCAGQQRTPHAGALPEARGNAQLLNEAKIDAELIAAQGKPMDTGGYYLPDNAKTSAAMRPSKTLNEALAAL